MEGEVGAILGLCVDGWWVGWLCGKYSSSAEGVYTEKMLINLCKGCLGPEVHCPGLSFSNIVLWCCQRHCKRVDHAEVCILCPSVR